MRETLGPPLRTAALLAFVTGLVLVLLNPPSLGGVGELLTLLAGIVAIVLVTAWAMVLLQRGEMPEEEYRWIAGRSERLAKLPAPEREPSEFDELVAVALDELPDEFRDALVSVPVVVSDRGREDHAYGHYLGGTVARDDYGDRIVIYQDTLERDFGHDPELLRAQVTQTVRHEIAHHLGWDERGVRDLGL